MSVLVIQTVSGAAGLQLTCFGEGELRARAVASRSLSILQAMWEAGLTVGPASSSWSHDSDKDQGMLELDRP